MAGAVSRLGGSGTEAREETTHCYSIETPALRNVMYVGGFVSIMKSGVSIKL